MPWSAPGAKDSVVVTITSAGFFLASSWRVAFRPAQNDGYPFTSFIIAFNWPCLSKNIHCTRFWNQLNEKAADQLSAKQAAYSPALQGVATRQLCATGIARRQQQAHHQQQDASGQATDSKVSDQLGNRGMMRTIPAQRQ